MLFKVIAFDLDGTLATDGHVTHETWEALESLRQAGYVLLLVTGRTLDTFTTSGPFREVFEAIVAENGAAVYFPRNEKTMLPFGQLASQVVEHLDRLHVPIEQGFAIAATRVPHDKAAVEVLRKTAGSATIEYNKGAVMILPPGATKGTGLMVALNELGYSTHNVIALGDAENDRSLFVTAELAVAVANATPEIRTLAHFALPEANGKGVQSFTKQLLNQKRLPILEQKDHPLVIGHREDGLPVMISPFPFLLGNLGIIGGSNSGKSWMAGLLVEEFLKQGYQLLVIDPEGDYVGLRAFPHTLVLGGSAEGFTSVAEVVTLCEYSDVSIILDLSLNDPTERQAYVRNLMQAIQGLRQRRGRPHWILFDELQNFCTCDDTVLAESVSKLMTDGGFSFVSYAPSQVPDYLMDLVDNWLFTHLEWPEELDRLERLLQTRPCQMPELDLLPRLVMGEAILSMRCSEPEVVENIQYRASNRQIPHVRHLHKYLDAPLPTQKQFYFKVNGNEPYNLVASSLSGFVEALETAPLKSITYHLKRGDFERWLVDVLHDETLAQHFRKIAHRSIVPERLREMLISTTTARYHELERLV